MSSPKNGDDPGATLWRTSSGQIGGTSSPSIQVVGDIPRRPTCHNQAIQSGERAKGLFDILDPEFLMSTGNILQVAGNALTVLGTIGSRKRGRSNNVKQLEEAEKRLSELQQGLQELRIELERLRG